MTLSRFPVEVCQNYGLTWRHRERRGCLHTDLLLPGNIVLHLFNVHLGTSFVERLHQVHMLLGNHVLSHTQWAGPRIVVVDFNEWTLAWPRDLWGSLQNSEAQDLSAARSHLSGYFSCSSPRSFLLRPTPCLAKFPRAQKQQGASRI